MTSPADDLVELIEHVTSRLVDRMGGLDDEEWSWVPIPTDPDVTIRWRLDHILDTLVEERNWTWLGFDVPEQPAAAPVPAPAPVTAAGAGATASAATASAAVRAVHDAAAVFAGLVRALGDDADRPIGPLAGPYGAATRRSFVLHVVDELIHHAAEAALLRDLYAGTRRT